MIIARLNELYYLLSETLASEKTRMRRMIVVAQAHAVLVFLEDYSKAHFAHEEALMNCRACPFRAKHARAHQTMVRMLDSWTMDIHRDVQAEENERMCAVIMDFGTWFEHHLRTGDCKLRALSDQTHPAMESESPTSK